MTNLRFKQIISQKNNICKLIIIMSSCYFREVFSSQLKVKLVLAAKETIILSNLCSCPNYHHLQKEVILVLYY